MLITIVTILEHADVILVIQWINAGEMNQNSPFVENKITTCSRSPNDV